MSRKIIVLNGSPRLKGNTSALVNEFSHGAREFVCKENFSALDFPLKKEIDALKNFAEKFNVTKIVTDSVAKFDEPVVSEWLEKFLENERNAVQVQVDRH